MPSRFYAEFPERKVSGGKAPAVQSSGPDNKSAIRETEVGWPKPGPAPGVGFNRKTKWPVVKTAASKAGKD